MNRIMIVDDNHQNRMVASGLLEDDYELSVVDSGEACMETLPLFRPDVILLDWMMPGLDGLGVVDKIRDQVAYKNLRIIMLTAKAQPGDITRAWRAGANDYITKPFEAEDLMAAVARQAGEKQRLDDLDRRWREMEEGIRQAQKMEALGSLAGGIAHDFNNILFPIQAYAEFLMCHPDRDVAEDATEIKTAAKRAGRLVAQILSFSRQSRKTEKEPVAVDLIVKEALKLIRASFPANIRIQTEVKTECGIVTADPTSIHQVIMNLCTNAKHAMEKTGGRLSVRLSDVNGPGEDGSAEEGYMELVVADTGTGIPEEIQKQVFAPYFTTKPLGKGTGMGLAIVKDIIEEIGGTIGLDSAPGKGTTFRMLIPAHKEECMMPEDETVEILGGYERILVVDDEPSIVDMLGKTLSGLGYTVKTFTDPEQVVQTLSRDTDLLITDMTMPAMNGMTLAEKVWQITPGLPVILMTGFSEAVSPEIAREKGIKEMLFKPVGGRDIAAAIRRLLDDRETETGKESEYGK